MLHMAKAGSYMHSSHRITRIVYKAIKEKACIWLCKATEMDRKERLRMQREQEKVG